MGVTAPLVHRLRDAGDAATPWSAATLVLCAGAEAATAAVVLQSDSDPGGVLWPVVATPLLLSAVALVVHSKAMRVLTAAGVAIFALIAAASVGLFFLPAAVTAVVAARRTRRPSR